MFTTKVPDGMLLESAAGWGREKLTNGLREVLAMHAKRLELSHEESIRYVADRLGKSHNTLYAWLSTTNTHYPISWPTLDLLRYEAALMDEPDDVRKRYEGMLMAYDKAWQRKNMEGKKAMKRVKRVPAS